MDQKDWVELERRVQWALAEGRITDLNVMARKLDAEFDLDMGRVQEYGTGHPTCPGCGSLLLPYSIELYPCSDGLVLHISTWCDACGGVIYTIMPGKGGAEWVLMDEDGVMTPLAIGTMPPWIGCHKPYTKEDCAVSVRIPRADMPMGFGR